MLAVYRLLQKMKSDLTTTAVSAVKKSEGRNKQILCLHTVTFDKLMRKKNNTHAVSKLQSALNQLEIDQVTKYFLILELLKFLLKFNIFVSLFVRLETL